MYTLTDSHTAKFDTLLGTVEASATDENVEYHGTYSNHFKVGTEIYSIEGVNPSQAIAVKSEDQTYVLMESTLESTP